MATHGNLGEFQPGKESWTSYTERLEQYFLANDVGSEEKKRAILLSVCGPSTYQLMRSLVAPRKPAEYTFAQLVKLIKDHHQPVLSVTVQRFAFNSRTRKDNESFADFIAALRHLSEHCAFGNSLGDMLRDRLICGCNNERLQRQLLAKTPAPSFEEVLTLAQAFESAEMNAKDLQHQSQTPIHAVRSKNPPRGPLPWTQSNECYRCGGKHLSSVCRFKNTVCSYCKKTGHIVRACRNKKKQETTQSPRSRSHWGTSRQTHLLTENRDTESDGSPDGSYDLFHLGSAKTQPISITLFINGARTEMEVDTGASASIISEVMYHKLWPCSQAPPLQLSTANLRTYSGEKLRVQGMIEVEVKYEDQVSQLPLLVVAGSGPSLLGRDWLLKIGRV